MTPYPARTGRPCPCWARPEVQALEVRLAPAAVLSILRDSPLESVTSASSVSFKATFSEAVTGVDANDFQLALSGTATGAIGPVTPVGDSIYTVTVGGITGIGNLGL